MNVIIHCKLYLLNVPSCVSVAVTNLCTQKGDHQRDAFIHVDIYKHVKNVINFNLLIKILLICCFDQGFEPLRTELGLNMK